MNRTSNQMKIWTIGLSDTDVELISRVGGKEFALVRLPEGNVPDAAQMDIDEPCLIWFTRESWNQIKMLDEERIQHLDVIPRILIFGGEYSLSELEEALESGFTDVIKPPLTEARIRDVLVRAMETQGLYHDIMRMTREIVLERELLSRKNDILSFIVSFMERATESLDPIDILRVAQSELSALLPVRAVNAACWKQTGDNALEASLFLTAPHNDTSHDKWVELMLGSAEKLSGKSVAGYQIDYLTKENGQTNLKPETGKTMILPLRAGGKVVGSIALLAENTLSLGKDQVQILRSAMQHLALALRNAMRYHEVRQHADFDGLTRVYNRRHFEIRLREELDRHSRYTTPMSLMMLDIDHFKAINDTYGHQTGDEVLKELAEILRDTVRSTDYVARYGGEEFVIILPHTTEEQGMRLAERIREKIASRPFIHENKTLNVTVSAGVASLHPHALENTANLMKEADQALYFAKANGRNLVCSFRECATESKNAVGS